MSNKDEGVVMPLYRITSPKNALVNGGYNVSFTKDDIKRRPGEYDVSYELKVMVQDYDRYSVEDIEGLKKGDKICIGGKNVEVKSVKSEDDGGEKSNYLINGGIHEEGYTLSFLGDFYRPTADSIIELYYDVGEVTIPVSTAATFINYSIDGVAEDGSGETIVVKDAGSTLEDVIKKYAGAQGYDSGNASIVVHNGEIIQIIKHYLP